MRPPPLTRWLWRLCLLASAAATAACSSQISQDPVYTSSLAPHPEVGMVREPPPPHVQTGSLGPTYEPSSPYQPGYRWSETQQNPTGPITPSPQPFNPQPARYHAYEPGWRAPMPRTGLAADPHVIEVREGETLYGIAHRHGVSVADLITENHLTGVKIDAGQKLRLPGR